MDDQPRIVDYVDPADEPTNDPGPAHATTTLWNPAGDELRDLTAKQFGIA